MWYTTRAEALKGCHGVRVPEHALGVHVLVTVVSKSLVIPGFVLKRQ